VSLHAGTNPASIVGARKVVPGSVLVASISTCENHFNEDT
jgi:hypothetical protein